MKECTIFDIQIRECTSLDILVSIANNCGLDQPPNDPAADLARILSTPYGKAFVAFYQDKPIGMAVAGYEGRRGWLYYVGVFSEFRRRGVGSQLVKMGTGYLSALGAPKVLLFIRDGQEHLASFYNHLGFTEQPVAVYGKELK